MTTPAEKHAGHHHDHHHHHQSSALERRPRLPAIPDLRFERSYLRSIQPYLLYKPLEPSISQHQRGETSESYDFGEAAHEKTASDERAPLVTTVVEERGEADGSQVVVEPSWGDIVSVKWGNILWVTTRDQLLSPFLQGAVWALASVYITPFSAQAGARVGAFVKSRLPTQDGLGVQKLRDWVKGLGITTVPSRSNVR